MKGKKRIHFIGIGGIGMSALARYYRSEGFAVSGSDSARSIITDTLHSDGIGLHIGHKASNLSAGGIALVIISQAIRPENPELVKARALGLPVLTYPQAVGELTREYKTIAIAGAHGKSTTTALAALALVRGGLDPTVIVGVNLKEFGGKNFRRGRRGEWLVLEADEFGRAFLHYSPRIAIVTNIDREHLDVYGNLANIKKTFLDFFANVEVGGTLILNRDDKNLFSLRARVVALAKKKKLRVVWYSIQNSAREKNLAAKLKKTLAIAGEHNLSNATAVYELGKILKNSEKKILTALGSYTGAWRRMEYRGKTTAIMPPGTLPALIYDDYAHHPTEIKATLKAFREKFPTSPLVCIFQPHQAKRLEALFKEFISAFSEADFLALIPSYTVTGRDAKASLFTAEKLAGAIVKKFPRKKIYYFANPKHIKKSLTKILATLPAARNASAQPVIIMMGAGDIFQYTDLLLK